MIKHIKRIAFLLFVFFNFQDLQSQYGGGFITTIPDPPTVNDEVVIRPMMFIFVSYDHRIIPGAVAQKFLVSVKEDIENIDYECL